VNRPLQKFSAFLLTAFCLALPLRSIAKNPLGSPSADAEADLVKEKSQIESDLEGLESKKRPITKGRRGPSVVKRYVSGPWKGGKAVIALNADMAFAEIRIFDAEEALQRLYSIHPASKDVRIDPEYLNDPVKMVEWVNSENVRSQAAAANRAPPARREQAQDLSGEPAPPDDQAPESGAPIAPSVPAVRPGIISTSVGDIREGSTLEAIEAQERAGKTPPRKRTIRVRRKRHRKTAVKNTLDTPLSGPAGAEEYYFENVVVIDSAPVPGSSSADLIYVPDKSNQGIRILPPQEAPPGEQRSD
jgi:hypothetical protein